MTSPLETPATSTRIDRFAPLALGVVASALVAIAVAPHGIGWSVDAANYVATARNLAAGQGYVGIGHEPFVHWAPLLPTLLAAPAKLGFEPLTVAAWLNAILYGCVVAFAARWLFAHITSRALAFAGAALVVCASPVFETCLFAWSEPLFVCASLVSMLALEHYARTRARDTFSSSQPSQLRHHGVRATSASRPSRVEWSFFSYS